MIKNLEKMVLDATSLEYRGLLRRAMFAWQDIVVHPEAKNIDRERARAKLMSISVKLDARVKKERDFFNSDNKDRSDIELDRKKVIDYFQQGLSLAEIQYLTGRSSAFVYSCKKLARAS